MLEAVVTVILLPFAIGAVVFSGAMIVGFVRAIKKRK